MAVSYVSYVQTVKDLSNGIGYRPMMERHVLAALCWFAVSFSFAQSLALFVDERMFQQQARSGGGGGGGSTPAATRGAPAVQQGGRQQQQGARVQQGAHQQPPPRAPQPSAASSSNKSMAVPMQSKVGASGQPQQQLQQHYQQQLQLPMSTATPPPVHHQTVYMGYPQQSTAPPAQLLRGLPGYQHGYGYGAPERSTRTAAGHGGGPVRPGHWRPSTSVPPGCSVLLS